MTADPGTAPAERWRPTVLEVAAGRLIGVDPAIVALPRGNPRVSPRQALEATMVPALQRAPCVVSFSGGRDSSAVLAVAALVARRQGLPLPVPATIVYPDLPETDETTWQESVIRHLGLPDWERIELHDELDIVGPVASTILFTHGVRWPPTASQLMPVAGAAAGGTLLSGLGGDEVFGTSGSHLMRVLARRARPNRRDVIHAGYAVAPTRLRARVVARRSHDLRPWLTPEGRESVDAELAAWEASVPERWNAALDAWWTTRELQSSLQLLAALGQASGVTVAHPLMDPCFLTAMRRRGGIAGFAGRTAVMRELFADVLPDSALTRVSKAVFDRAVRTTSSDRFVATWDGTGLEALPVRPEVLRQMWSSPEPCFQTFLLLQTAWLETRASRGEDVEQPLQ